MNTVIDLYRNDNQVVTDAFDRIVVEVFMEKEKNGHSTFLICGCDAQVGTTSISVELAISLAVSGWKTILVDADLRKDAKYKRLNQKTEVGLSDYVTDKTFGKSIIYHTNWVGLDYISCGKNNSETPVKMLCSRRMGMLMEKLKEDYDFAIFDMPSLNSAVDAKILGAKLDCTYLVAAAGQTTFKNLSGAWEQMKEAGANVAGVVFNKVSFDEYEKIVKNYNYFSEKEYLEGNKFYDGKKKGKNKKSFLKRFFGKILGGFLVSLIIAVAGNTEILRAESLTPQSGTNEQMPMIIVSEYSIQDGICAAGNHFTMKITIENVSQSVSAHEIVLSLYPQTEGVVLQSGETNQRHLEYLAPGAEADFEFDMSISENVVSDAGVIELTSTYTNEYGTGGTNASLISPEIQNMSKLNILSVTASDSAVMGSKALFSIRYENSGNENIAAAFVRLEGNIESSGEEIELEVPEIGRQNYKDIEVIFTKTGNQELDAYVTYRDINGNNFELDPRHLSVLVMQRQTGDNAAEVQVVNETSFFSLKNILVITVLIIGIVFFAVCIFVLYGRRRRFLDEREAVLEENSPDKGTMKRKWCLISLSPKKKR